MTLEKRMAIPVTFSEILQLPVLKKGF